MEPRIVTYTKGYLRILLKGYSPERFLNICSSKDIFIWDLERTTEGFLFCISIKDYRRLRPVVRKTKTRLLIRNRYGFPFFLYKYRKRKMYFCGLFSFFILIYLLSLFIWDIHIEGNYSYTDNVLLDFLEEKDVVHGMKKSTVSCQDIEKMLRNQYNDITWVSASISGTRLIIQIQENFDNLIETDAENEIGNIVASDDCRITSIVTRSGTPMVKKGDIAAKGDILVSGIVEITDDYGEHLRYDYVRADADISGETVEEYSDSIPLVAEKKRYTGKEKKGYAMTFFSKKCFLYSPRAAFSSFDSISSQYQLRLGGNFYLPFFWETFCYKEYELETISYSKEEAELLLNKNRNAYFENLIEKGVQIVRNNVKIQIGPESGTASGQITTEREVGVFIPVDFQAERIEEADEYN